MKNLIILLSLTFSLVGCEQEGSVQVIKEVRTEYQAQDFEGFYYFENNSQIELVASYDGDVSLLKAGQFLQSENPSDGSLASHPVLQLENLAINNGKITQIQDVSYVAGNVLKADTGGAAISGSRRTDFVFELDSSRKLKLTIKVYSGPLNNLASTVVATRVFESL